MYLFTEALLEHDDSQFFLQQFQCQHQSLWDLYLFKDSLQLTRICTCKSSTYNDKDDYRDLYLLLLFFYNIYIDGCCVFTSFWHLIVLSHGTEHNMEYISRVQIFCINISYVRRKKINKKPFVSIDVMDWRIFFTLMIK